MKTQKLLTTLSLVLIVFFISCKKDNLHPTVVSTYPINEAVNIPLNIKIALTFSMEMDETTLTSSSFTVREKSDEVLGINNISGVVECSGTNVTFTPNVDLLPNTVYTGKISSEAENISGQELEEEYIWNFTTGDSPDNTSPSVNSTNPINNTIEVERNIVITVTFSEEMNPLTITNSSFILKKVDTEIPGTVTYSGRTASFTPTNNLDAGTSYTATLSNTVEDLAGNAILNITTWNFKTGGSISILTAVNIGTSGNYVILAKTAINNNSTSAIIGDIGLSPAATSYITGFSLTNATGYATSAQITGKIYAADMATPTPINLTTAVENMITAYTDAAGRQFPDFFELGIGNIGGKTLSPGLYKWTSTVTVPSNVTISGTANDVWIFQIAGDLIVSSAVNITLEGGAQAKNIFWQVAGHATFRANSHFEGIILSMTGITFETNASFNGRALAQTAVVLDANAISLP
jgi:hypothetical protein